MLTLAPADPEARVDEISIWCLDLTRIAPEPMRALLSDAERARAERFKIHGDVDRFVTGRGALRHILAGLTGTGARSLVFEEGSGRKPALIGHPYLQFNLSHSGDFVLIAVGREPLGVDIEAIREIDWSALATMNFHPDERAILASRSGAAALDAFFQIWAHKEAYLKATGIGLTDHLTSIAVPLAGGLISDPKAPSPGNWYATPLVAPPGYKASIVAHDAHPTIQDLTGSFAAPAFSPSSGADARNP